MCRYCQPYCPTSLKTEYAWECIERFNDYPVGFYRVQSSAANRDYGIGGLQVSVKKCELSFKASCLGFFNRCKILKLCLCLILKITKIICIGRTNTLCKRWIDNVFTLLFMKASKAWYSAIVGILLTFHRDLCWNVECCFFII